MLTSTGTKDQPLADRDFLLFSIIRHNVLGFVKFKVPFHGMFGGNKDLVIISAGASLLWLLFLFTLR